jgi:hypothetical protein
MGSSVPFVSDTKQSYLNIGAWMFKYPLLMGIFLLPPLFPTTKISHVNMVSSFTSGSIGYVGPWVVPRSEDFDSYGASIPLTMVVIVDMEIASTLVYNGHQTHPHMECDKPTPPIRVVDSLSSHDSLDFEFPLEEAILEVVASINNPREDENHQESILPSLDLMIFNMMSLDPGLGEFIGASNSPPSLEPFPLWLYFS